MYRPGAPSVGEGEGHRGTLPEAPGAGPGAVRGREGSDPGSGDRTQLLLPMRPGQVERRTHDYLRNGTISLFAALNAHTGKIIGQCLRRHRSVEFRKFLDKIEASVPTDLDIHLVLDNYGTHKTALIHRWLAKRPRFHLHFTPTSAS